MKAIMQPVKEPFRGGQYQSPIPDLLAVPLQRSGDKGFNWAWEMCLEARQALEI